MKNVLILVLFCWSCSKNNNYDNPPEPFGTSGSTILQDGKAKQFIGVNAMHSFGGNSNDMSAWNIDIVREFVGNVKQNPLDGNPILDQNGVYLHPLQKIIDNNRQHNKVTIICAFGWDGTAQNEFTGKSPQQTFWWNDFRIKLAAWASFFKNQPDVWIEVWNEPYRFDRADNYTDEVWLSDMNSLVSSIRDAGNKNIVVVPCAEQGQDESVLINKGTLFLASKKNIVFDIHAYEKWLLVPENVMRNRLLALKNKNFPIFFGEIAPLNAGVLMNPQAMLSEISDQGMSVCAWLWKYDQNDVNALLSNNGLPNDNANYNWGTLYKNLTISERKP